MNQIEKQIKEVVLAARRAERKYTQWLLERESLSGNGLREELGKDEEKLSKEIDRLKKLINRI